MSKIKIQYIEDKDWKNVEFTKIIHEKNEVLVGRPFRILVNGLEVYNEKGQKNTFRINGEVKS